MLPEPHHSIPFHAAHFPFYAGLHLFRINSEEPCRTFEGLLHIGARKTVHQHYRSSDLLS